MTRQEAIDILNELKKCYLGGICDAIDMALSALQAQETPIEKVAEDYGLTVDGVSFALDQYEKVINYITDGRMSKLCYYAADILSVANDVQCEGYELKERSEVNPNCHGLGYEECGMCESVCPYR